MKNLALVIGGYVNGYSMLQELHEMDVENIGLLYYNGQLSRFSNKPTYKREISIDAESLISAIEALKLIYDKIVLYPCDENQIEQLVKYRRRIESFCFFPFNKNNIRECLDKKFQYDSCEKLNIPFPKTVGATSEFTVADVENLLYPIIIKPIKRYEKEGMFRIERIDSFDDFKLFYDTKLSGLIEQHCNFVISELIPGDTNKGLIYAYTCYRSPLSGEILNEWVGRKESQFPDDYGIFSTASSLTNDIVLEYGRRLVTDLDAYGIVEPEFKFDERDGKYKLMEVNFRSMMWHRTGNLAGVKLQYTQWLDAIGEPSVKFLQNTANRKFSYLLHEMYNLVRYKSYYRYFKRNVLGRDCYLALWDKNDLIPFMYDSLNMMRMIFRAFLNRIKNA